VSCSAQTGPLPGEGSNPEPAASLSSASAAHAPSQPSSSSGATTTTTPSSAAAGGLTGPNSGLGGLSQLIGPLLQGIR